MWAEWKSGAGREEVGGLLVPEPEREPGVYFPASALWTGACWMMGLKSLLIRPLCFFFFVVVVVG